jgi:hypothetical protein
MPREVRTNDGGGVGVFHCIHLLHISLYLSRHLLCILMKADFVLRMPFTLHPLNLHMCASYFTPGTYFAPSKPLDKLFLTLHLLETSHCIDMGVGVEVDALQGFKYLGKFI